MMTDCFTAFQQQAEETYRLAWARGILVYTLLPLPFFYWLSPALSSRLLC